MTQEQEQAIAEMGIQGTDDWQVVLAKLAVRIVKLEKELEKKND